MPFFTVLRLSLLLLLLLLLPPMGSYHACQDVLALMPAFFHPLSWSSPSMCATL